jgi:hypothetical protein
MHVLIFGGNMPDLTRVELIKILAIATQARLAGVDLSGIDMNG